MIFVSRSQHFHIFLILQRCKITDTEVYLNNLASYSYLSAKYNCQEHLHRNSVRKFFVSAIPIPFRNHPNREIIFNKRNNLMMPYIYLLFLPTLTFYRICMNYTDNRLLYFATLITYGSYPNCKDCFSLKAIIPMERVFNVNYLFHRTHVIYFCDRQKHTLSYTISYGSNFYAY